MESHVRKKKISGLCYYVHICVFENISKVMFLRAGLENNDFTTSAVIPFHGGVLSFSKQYFFVILKVFFCLFVSFILSG